MNRTKLPAWITAKHTDLLATYRELIAGIGGQDLELDPESLLAIVAFLRQGVRPFARLEEDALAPASEARESAAFEHAFLAAETERLAREIRAMLDAVRSSDPGAASEVVRARRALHRTLDRIEAILEMHVLREEGRDG